MELVIAAVIVVVVAAILGVYVWASYNSLVALNRRVDEAWSDITVQVKRRSDLLPRLVDAVQGYASHERAVFDAVTRARADTVAAPDATSASAAENRMQTAIKSLFRVAEGYPQLQSSQEFLSLQADLVETEDKIQASRRFYNGGVRELNSKVKSFPNSLYSRRAGIHQRAFFEVSSLAAISEPPRVQF
jgi:LemA protein